MHLAPQSTPEWRDKQRAKEFEWRNKLARRTGNLACIMGPASVDLPILMLDADDYALLKTDSDEFDRRMLEVDGGDIRLPEVRNRYVIAPFLPLPVPEPSAEDQFRTD